MDPPVRRAGRAVTDKADLEQITRDLAGIAGAAHVSAERARLREAASSWSPVALQSRRLQGDSSPAAFSIVTRPADTREVAALVVWANRNNARLVPVGGASNLVGANEPGTMSSGRAVVAVDLGRLDALSWDEESLIVTAGAGRTLASVEADLQAHGYTLGHFLQSANLATVGGAVATDAIGLFSGRYGRQGDLTIALEAVLPTGEIIQTTNTGGFPDLHRLLIGSEGTLGIVTSATLRMAPSPDVRAWAVFAFDSFSDGMDALRLVYRSDARPTLARLLDPDAASKQRMDVGAGEVAPPAPNNRGASDTEGASASAGVLAPPLLGAGGATSAVSLLLLAFEGSEAVQTGQYQMAFAVCKRAGGRELSPDIAETWFDERATQANWLAPNGRAGGLADAWAVYAPWARVKSVADAFRRAAAPLTVVQSVVACHPDATGCALELFYEAQSEPATPEAALALHARISTALTDALLDAGAASLTHHWGVGSLRRAAQSKTLGPAHIAALQAVKGALDPAGVLRPV